MIKLGLQLFPSYLAYAVIEKIEDKNQQKCPILEAGVLYFTPAENPKNGTSLNAPRSNARRSRLHLARIKRRVRLVRNYLNRISTIDNHRFNIISKDAWDLRVKGLDSILTIDELAVVCTHLATHRGYRSNRLDQNDEETKGKVLESIAKTKEVFKTEDVRTYAEMLKSSITKRNRRGQYNYIPTRDMIIEEYRAIISAQPNFTLEKINKLEGLIFYQRPLKAVDLFIGNCSIFPEEKRSPKASFTFNIFNLYSMVNKLEIINYDKTKPKYLITHEDRLEIIKSAFEVKKVTFNKIRKILKLDESYKFNFELNTTKKHFFEFTPFHLFNEIFKPLENFKYAFTAEKPFDLINETEKLDFYDGLIYLLSFIFDEEDLYEKLVNYFSKSDLQEFITEDLIDKLMKITSFSGTASLSIKAMRFFMTEFKKGLTYQDVYSTHFAKTIESQKLSVLPPFETCYNAVVDRVNAEARKVLNALMRKYKFDEITLNSSKELGKSVSDRRKIVSVNKINQKINLEAEEVLNELGIENITSFYRTKAKLWLVQNKKCLYSNTPITKGDLLSNNVSVTHIIPYSRSLDDSFDNKALVLTDILLKKNKQTFYEMSSKESSSWGNFVKDINQMYDDKQLRKRKLEKILVENIEEEELKARHIVDSRYINKRFKEHLAKYIFNEDEILLLPRQVVHSLKTFWRIDEIVSKDSDNEDVDAHFKAIDAIVTAVASRRMLETIASAVENEESCSIPQPFLDFKQMIINFLPNIKINKVINAKGTGQLHGETIYKLPFNFDKSKYIEHTNFVINAEEAQFNKNKVRQKVALENLNLKKIEQLTWKDSEKYFPLYEEVKKRLIENNDNGAKAFIDPIFSTKPNGRISRIYSADVYTDMRSGIFKSNGICANGDLIRVEIFSNGTKLAAMPIYALDIIHKTKPDWIMIGSEIVPLTSEYEYQGTFFKNAKVLLRKFDDKGNLVKEVIGFFQSFNRSNLNCILTNATKRDDINIRVEKTTHEYLSVSLRSFNRLDMFNYDILESKYLIKNIGKNPFTEFKKCF